MLDRTQLDALERAGALVALGELDAARAILADTLPARSLDRTTPLDVEVVGRARALALAALTAEHAHALPPLERLSLTQRDVSAQAERTFVGRAMRIDRLVHHRAPAMMIDNEIALLHEAVERLDAREAPAGIDDELGFLPDDVITRLADAGFTLSLGGFAGVIAEVADARRRANDEASGPEELAFGRPLLASDVEDDDVQAWRAWTVIEGPQRAAEMAEAIATLRADLAALTTSDRETIQARFESDLAPLVVCDDWIAALDARLATLALDVKVAVDQGLVVVSRVSFTS